MGKTPYTIDEIRKIFKEQGCELLADTYTNNQTKMPYICSCGNTSSIHLANFSMGRRCNECAKEKRAAKRRLKFEDVKKEFEEAGFILLDTEYKNTTTTLRCICKCGRMTTKTISHIREGKTCRACFIERISGSNARQYRHDISDEFRRRRRHDPDHKAWRKEVFSRDNYTCQKCSSRKSGNLNAHHLKSYDIYVNDRYKTHNGITLCVPCHREFHLKYGYGKNNTRQFLDWLINDDDFPKSIPLVK